MNQNTKSAIFIGAAAVAALGAWLARPTMPSGDNRDQRGKLLIETFDPTTATSLKIVEFDEETSTPRPFEVRQAQVKHKGKVRWSIPSHGDYPADAQNQLAEAATALVGLEILSVASEKPGDHELYGVVDPESKDLQGATGVGTRVVMKDKEGRTVASVILGKAVANRPDLRYVRRDNEDPVYVVKVKTDKISAKFGDWIEKDLLKMSLWDLKQVYIGDYAVDTLQGELRQEGEMLLGYDDAADAKWKLIKGERRHGNRAVPDKLAPDEELNTANLDAMKTALEDLKIVDVLAKPPVLSADLKASADFLANKQACQSLAEHGFYAVTLEDHPEEREFLSNAGEVRFYMKDGVEYVLRFGAAAGAADKAAGKKTPKDSGHLNLNRYLLVMAEFDPDMIPKPVLEPLPSEPAAEKTGKTAEKAAGKNAEKTAKPGEADKGKAEPKGKAGDKADKTDKTGKAGKAAPAAKEPPKKEAPKPDLKAERQRIEKENQRKREQYDEQVAAGKKHVQELNSRFADWYYVISDDVYRKLHLSRKDVVKKKEKKDAAAKAGHDESLHHHHDHDDADEDQKPDPIGDLKKLKEGLGEHQ
jgi:hypothetical protein